MSPIVGIIQALLVLLQILFIARFIAQLFDAMGRNPITRTLIDITEPILAPVRRILPPMGGLDLSPTIVLLLLFMLQQVLG